MVTNSCIATGNILTELEYDHTVFSGEKLYTFNLGIPRMSSTVDEIPVLILESFLTKYDLKVDDCVRIKGSIRSHNVDTHSRLNLFVDEIDYTDTANINGNNEVNLIGFICKEPIYRITPLGREIADVIIAVNRSRYASDYIPSICWGENARYMSVLPVGTKLKLSGRFQSRTYVKKLDDENEIEKTAYELSIREMSIID